MSESLKIEADRHLRRGDESPVKIVVDFDASTKVRGIHATFHAAEKTQASYVVTTTDSEGKARVETRTSVEFVDIAKESFLLFGQPRKGFFSRIGDSMATWVGGGEHEIIEPGKKEFSLNLKIPVDAPASFKGQNCEVFYRLDVAVDLPIRIDWSNTRMFDVGMEVRSEDINPVHVVFPDESGRSFWDRTVGKNVTLNLALDRDSMRAGEKVLAMLTVDTPDPLNLNGITAELVGTEATTAHGHKDTYHHRHSLEYIDTPATISNELIHEFELQIPTVLELYSQSGQNFAVSWEIEVRLKVPWAKDPIIRVPVKILPATKS